MSAGTSPFHCSNCAAPLPASVAGPGGACPFCGAAVAADPAWVRARDREREEAVKLQRMNAEADAARAQAEMMHHLADVTAQGQERVARADAGSRRAGRLYAFAIGLLLLIVLARVAWNNLVVYPRMMRDAAAAQAAGTPADDSGPPTPVEHPVRAGRR